MVKHEKNTLFKFFFIYFFSVAILILTSGWFYYEQAKEQFLKSEHFSLIEYARTIKRKESLQKFKKEFSHKIIKINKEIKISNFHTDKDRFYKFIPTKKRGIYLKVFKSKKSYIEKIDSLKIKIIIFQVILLLIFAVVSFILARFAIKPLRDSVEMLDKFIKDLIHDINTPISSMKLNIKILEKDSYIVEKKAFWRLKKSILNIVEFEDNLTILLEKKTFKIESHNICKITKDVIEIYKEEYKNLHFIIECNETKFTAMINKNALEQILHNLISNACKYNKPNGFIKIYTKDKTLCIENSGMGIKDIDKIFDRNYSTQNSTGLGLDIVKRLSKAMNIKVDATSSTNGSLFMLTFS